VPSYYDPAYDCEMELLRFDSRRPNPKYAGVIERLRETMADICVIGLPEQRGNEERRSQPRMPPSWSPEPETSSL
jgi:hypothetical protein